MHLNEVENGLANVNDIDSAIEVKIHKNNISIYETQKFNSISTSLKMITNTVIIPNRQSNYPWYRFTHPIH